MSESPEEQRSPGVLGRIGSWFSPWRVKSPTSPTSPTENTSATGEQTFKSEAEEENEESVRPQAKEQQKEEEQSFSPSLYRDIFPCEEENVRHSAIVSSTEAAGTGASGEEFLESRKKGIGLGKENQENGNGTSESGNPKKNASNLRDFSSEPAVISAYAQPLSLSQTQTQTGKKIHVYLEDTSVIQCRPDGYAGKEVVRTKVPKSLQIAGGAKSSQGFESLHTSTATGAQSKRANARPSDGSEGVTVGGSLKSHKEAQLDPHKGQTDRMGRRNAARRKSRKNSQGDGGNSPHEKKSPGAENVPEGFPSDNSGTSLQGKTQETHTADSSLSSTSKNNPTPQTSPEIGEGNTSCSDRVEKQENIRDSSSVTADAPASVIDGAADMEDDDSLYKVERRTETPESKRRSIKVSQSEVKFFTKTLRLNPKQNPAKDNQDLKSSLKDEAIHKPKPEIQARHDLRKMGEDRKPVSGRIADKISLFESPAKEVNKAFQNSRSADASPVRTVTDRLKGNSVSLDQRSGSVECYVKARSNSASPNRERLTTIKERVRTFAETPAKHDTAVLPPKSGMSQKPTSSVAVAALNTGKLDSQGKLDAKDQIQANTKLEVTSKPDGPHTIASGEKSISKERSTDSKVKDTVDSKTADQSRETNSVEAKVPATESGDSVEQTNNSNPQSKGPIRTSSRSKRRRSRESPKGNSENKEDCSSPKSVITSGNQQHVDDTLSASEQFAVSLSDKAEGNLSDEQFFSDSKQKAFQKEPKVKDKALHSSFIKENVDEPVSRQDSEPSINKDEPDTAACSSGTKPCIDMESVVSLPTEETTGENRLLFTQETEKAMDSRETTAPSSSSPALVQGMEKQDPPVHSRLDKASLVQLEQKNKETAMEPNKNDTGNTQQPQLKDTGVINHSEVKGMEKSDKSDQTNQTEKTDKETPQRVTDSNKNVKESVAVNDKKKSAGKTHAETQKQQLATESLENTILVPLEHTHITQVEISQETPACAITNTDNEEAESGIKSDREPLMGEADVSTRATESPGTKESVRIAVETQAESLLVEQMDNAPNVPCAHGANDAELPTANLLTSATSATEKVIVKATSDAPVLITTQADSVSEKDSSFEEPALPSASKSVSRETAGCSDGRNTSAVKSAPLEDAISADIMDVTPECVQGEASKTTESARDCSLNTSRKGVEKMELQPGGVLAITHTADVEGKTFYSPLNELSPVGNDDISLHTLIHTVKKETANDKASHTQKIPANKLIPDSIHHSFLKKLTLPRGFSKDDSVTQQDSPSSWLDVDLPKERFKMPVPKLSASGSESNLLDTSGELDDDDFVEKIKKLCAPFSLPPRKHNPLGPPQPPFAMPAIREDRFEKPFDPEQFNFGLRKNNKYTLDTTTLAKLQKTDGKSGPKSARASLADRSILLGSLDTHSRLKTPIKDEEQANEEKGEQVKVKSRLEGSCVLSSLTSSIYRGKRNGVQTQAEATNSGSPSNTHLSPPPPLSPTASTAAPQKDMLAKQSPAPDNREEAQAVVSDSGPPFPSFSDFKLPDYLEKYLPREPTTQNIRGQKQVKTEVSEKMPTQSSEVETDLGVKPSPGLPQAVPPSFPGNAPTAHPIMTDHKQPATRQPQDILSKNIQKRTAKGFHKRPGKMVLFENAQFNGQAYEVYRDVADATSLKLSSLISVKVVRGCWVLYESPGFQGRSIALEEGGIELTNVWAENGLETEPEHIPPMVIGSIRLAVADYSIPRIDLYSEPEGLGIVTSYHDDTIETGSFGIPLSTASIQVQSGVWLVFSDPGFQGMLAVLEMGEYPVPETWGFSSPFVGSLRPLKMGGFKVENASEVKAVVYEKPGFQGSCLEVDGDVYSFCESEDGENLDSKKPKSVGSLKIIGGLWVGYSEPGFEGQQHILEEGEYVDCSEWGGSEHLQSLQPVLSDLFSPHLKMFRDREFGGASIDVSVPVINMEDTGYGMKTQSVDVTSGVWVVFEEPGFCGDCYILETGLYGCSEDWGALQPRIASVMPVVLSDFENAAKFKVQLFSEPGFQGSALVLEDSVASLKDGFSVGSCKVLAGNWLAFEGQDFSGRMYVLEVGRYSDLKSMGFLHRTSSIQSLQIVGFEFSLPSITLFERSGLRGKKVILNNGTVNLQLAGGCSRVQSVLVEGGMWVLYEGLNYRGAQMFLKPGEVLDWYKFSSWLKIGSLRPLTQKQVHFRLRNKQTGLLMSVTGDLDDIKMMRIQETEENDGFEQIWFYQNGYLHCKLLEQCFLCHSGSVMMAGSRIGLTAEPNNQVWNISPEGIIYYTPTPDLVLDVKGGHHYDKNQVILNKCDPNKLQQKWTVEIL